MVYHWDGEKTTVSYENCIECGACRMICPYNNISCVMPRGGYGIRYQYG
jgi:ferredoxin like protein